MLQAVSVGTTSRLGLRFPISATSDVQQQGRRASGVSSYTLEAIGEEDVDVTCTTVDVDPIADGDSLEWAVLASE